ncbi:hypothetical protein PLESTB_001285900 [Pleodorina starrii]|uniref:Uncharacterized protein n=1 Tax=Pleodorina starrii TaxID=330485 RepID=A0A9W6BU21_9CHLO|nr:hypothetical protein PLESTB_001285900 [Pleodorina starrii]GLC67117.1 hypothetical protein PLESTF_000517200 [Pleodorina starrii]
MNVAASPSAEANLLKQERVTDNSTPERRLQSGIETDRQCIVTASGCDINLAFVTSFNATPTTASQKLLALTVALNKTCFDYASKAACIANPSEYCTWVENFNGGFCMLSNKYLKLSWLNNRVDCPDSLADSATTCSRLSSNQTACNARSDCRWNGALGTVSSSIADVIDTWVGGE